MFNTILATGEIPEDYPIPLTPDPLRFAGELNAFAAADELSMPAINGIVATGSSTMRMWHNRIENDLPGLSLIKRGFGGSQFSDVIYFAEELILKYKPRAVMIYEGDNDVNAGKSAERVLDDLVFLVTHCRKELPNLRFYVLSVKPSIARLNHWPEMVRTNELMRAYAEGKNGIFFIDTYSNMLNEEGLPKNDIFLGDNLHLNTKGYDLWAESVAPILIASEIPYENDNEPDLEPLATWNGFEIPESGIVDTENWIGLIDVRTSPWIYSSNLNLWMYKENKPITQFDRWVFLSDF